MKLAEKSRPYSFRKGYQQLRLQDVTTAKEELMKALGITTMQNFRKRLTGEVIPKANEFAAIEKVFRKYKITKIWGE